MLLFYPRDFPLPPVTPQIFPFLSKFLKIFEAQTEKWPGSAAMGSVRASFLKRKPTQVAVMDLAIF
jgi:hypothetical protein